MCATPVFQGLREKADYELLFSFVLAVLQDA